MAGATNLTQLSGRLLERDALRYTPGGVAVLEFILGHRSQQIEAGKERTVDVEIACVAVDSLAKLLSTPLAADATVDPPGVRVSGFLAARSLKRRTPVLHVTHIEFVEGKQNGI